MLLGTYRVFRYLDPQCTFSSPKGHNRPKEELHHVTWSAATVSSSRYSSRVLRRPSPPALTQNPGRIPKVDPPILGSNTPAVQIMEPSREIYFLDPRGLGIEFLIRKYRRSVLGSLTGPSHAVLVAPCNEDPGQNRACYFGSLKLLFYVSV